MGMIRLRSGNDEIAVRVDSITCVHTYREQTHITLECGTEWIVKEPYDNVLQWIAEAEDNHSLDRLQDALITYDSARRGEMT